ncbi:MAG: SLC13 family permease [Syntrophales bacterium]|nr:SLC13 family permease [Syntrophales bacterium]
MTVQIALVFIVFAVTVYLFVSERLRVDVTAILVMVLLPWLGLLKPADAFSGLGSNAVVALIAVMILGHGVDRSGAINRIVNPIVSAAGSSERKLVFFVTLTVGFISAFMQNVAAAALFLPAILRISRSKGMSASRFLMPVGFAAILGGNLTMVGSTPLIMLNDLLRQGGHGGFSLFAVSPVGVVLVLAGALYFLFFSNLVLPPVKDKPKHSLNIQQMLIERWRLPTTIYQCRIPAASPLVGKTRENCELWTKYRIYLLALADGDDILYAPWRHTPFAAGQRLVLLGEQRDLARFVSDFGLMYKKDPLPFEHLETGGRAGFAEMVLPVGSPLEGKTIREISFRKIYGVEPIMLFSGEKEQRGDFSDEVLQAGNAIIVHGRLRQVRSMADNNNFILISPIEGSDELDDPKPVTALLCLLAAILLAISGVPFALGLLTGALAMILLRVLPMDEAYRAIEWKTVFLIAGLIPLGVAMNQTGASQYLASLMLALLQGTAMPVAATLVVFGIFATLLGLFISNVAATVMLVPLAMVMGSSLGIDPRGLSLLVVLCASNTFMLPTNQVTAMIMSPGGYSSADFMKAGMAVTVIYIVAAVAFVYLFHL